MKPPGDRDVPTAEFGDPQRHEHLDRAEHQRGDGDEGGRGEHRAGQRPPRHLAQRLSLRRFGFGQARRRRRQRQRDPQHRAEDRAGPDLGGDRADDRPGQRAGDGGSQRRADHRAAALRRSAGDQPGQRAGPGERPRHPLHETGQVEQHDVVGEAEGEAGEAEQQQAGDHRAARPHAGGDETGGERGEQGAGRVGRCEDSRLRLAQAEFRHVVRQQRRDRRVERDVEEDHRRSQNQQPAHSHLSNHPELFLLHAFSSINRQVASTYRLTPPEGWQSG